jgi:hypothetical protein
MKNSQEEEDIVRHNRKSTSKITYEQVVALFDLSEDDASKKLGITKHQLKHIRKKMNIQRWPYRRLHCIKKELISTNKLLKEGIGVADSTKHGYHCNDSEMRETLLCRVNSLKLACKLICKSPNLICKYDINTIVAITRALEKVQISNLIHSNDREFDEREWKAELLETLTHNTWNTRNRSIN